MAYSPMTPGYQQPSFPVAAGPVAPPLVAFGDIVVTPTEVITPRGRMPLAQARFAGQPMLQVSRTTPTWAVVMAVVGFFILTVFSLFFLLIKEDQVSGAVQVSVTGGGFAHVCQVPVQSHLQAQEVMNRVSYANQVVASTLA